MIYLVITLQIMCSTNDEVILSMLLPDNAKTFDWKNVWIPQLENINQAALCNPHSNYSMFTHTAITFYALVNRSNKNLCTLQADTVTQRCKIATDAIPYVGLLSAGQRCQASAVLFIVPLPQISCCSTYVRTVQRLRFHTLLDAIDDRNNTVPKLINCAAFRTMESVYNIQKNWEDNG